MPYISVKSSMIDRTLCESAVEECNQEQDDDRYSIVKTLNYNFVLII